MVEASVESISVRAFLPLITFLAAQTFAAIWWASGVSANLDFLKQQVSSATADRYRAVDAIKDFAYRDADLIQLNRRMGDMERFNAGKPPR